MPISMLKYIKILKKTFRHVSISTDHQQGVCLYVKRESIWIVGKPYTGCPRRNMRDFGRVFLMLNYTDITQNTYIQSWTVTEIMAREKCGLLGCPRTVRRPWRHIRPLRMPGNETPIANIAMQWPWRDNDSCGLRKLLGTLKTTMTWVRVFL